MTAIIDNTLKIEKLLEEAKTAIAKAYQLLFETEYNSLFPLAYEITKDTETAKEIIEESFSAVLESGLSSFQADPAQVKSRLLDQTRASCLKHINEAKANKEFQMAQAAYNNFNNSNEEEIIKAALTAFDTLPEFRKMILYETLLSNASARQ